MDFKTLIKKRSSHLIIAGILAGMAVVYTIVLVSGLPSLEQLEHPKPELATKVYSIDGELIDQFYIKNRTSITLGELPEDLVNALIATEDKDFYDHWGVDLPRFARAMIKNLMTLR